MTQISGVYFVNNNDFNPIAIRPTFYGNRCDWEDTGRGSHFYFDKAIYEGGELPEKIVLIRGEERVELILMTEEIFRKNVAAYAKPDLEGDAAVQHYYLNQEFPFL